MKKAFALLFALGAMTAVFAQNGRSRNESRDVILGSENNRPVYNDRRGDDRRDDRYDNNRYFSKKELDDRIERINRDYAWKIESVKRDRYLRNAEKKRQVRALENERKERIREIRERFRDQNKRRY
jgi:hypothetical protein